MAFETRLWHSMALLEGFVVHERKTASCTELESRDRALEGFTPAHVLDARRGQQHHTRISSLVLVSWRQAEETMRRHKRSINKGLLAADIPTANNHTQSSLISMFSQKVSFRQRLYDRGQLSMSR